MAARYGHTGMMDCLLGLPKIDLNAGNSSRYGTALHCAVRSGHQGCVERLVDAGANIDAIGAKKKMTPLHLAAERGHLEIIK